MSAAITLALRGGRKAKLKRPVLMGVLNATPDSFFDGDPSGALHSLAARLDRMAEEGIPIVDIGGESTRPGSLPVPLRTELDRVIPVLRMARKKYPDLIISIDTTKAAVADAALQEGADFVNDTSAGEDSEGLIFETCARTGCGIVLMHRQGRPDRMQDRPRYANVVSEVRRALKARAQAALRAGLDEKQLILDPGIGFGKLKEHNLALLAGLESLKDLGYPVLVGASMKRIVGDLTGRETKDRLAGTLGLHLAAYRAGADILRLHEPWAMKDALLCFQAVETGA